MDEDCECLFCQRDDLNLYEINQNSILIGAELVDFREIIFELFSAHANNDIVNYICEECKDLLTSFYVFKQSSKHSLTSSVVIDKLKIFLNKSEQTSLPIVKSTTDQFIVSFVPIQDPNIRYSVVKPIVKFKHSNEIKEEIVKFEHQPSPESCEVKFTEAEIEEEIHEGDDYTTVESIMETDDNYIDDTETCYEEHEECEEKNESDVEIKFTSEVVEKVYRCDCGSVLGSAVELQKHLNTHKRKSTGNETCCGVGFKDFKALAIHKKSHENFEAIAPHLLSFTCEDCNVMYSNAEDLKEHVEKHKDGGEFDGDFLIERRGAYEDHFLRNLPRVEESEVEDGEDLMTCGHCKKKFNDIDMKIHLLFFHTTTVFCPLDNRCFEGTKHVRLFSDHIRNKHPEIFEKILLYSCRHCNKSFTTCFEKLAHMKLCNSKLFPCPNHCNKRFATEWLLKSHLKHINGEERFTCQTCGKRCVSRSDLQIHERMHTNERPYPCPICDKKFKTSANRSSHMDIHENEKRHECAVCGEKFQTRPILRKHKKIHDEKYQEECVCKVCDRKYVTKQHLLRHVKTSHGAPTDLSTEAMNGFFEEFLEMQGR